MVIPHCRPGKVSPVLCTYLHPEGIQGRQVRSGPAPWSVQKVCQQEVLCVEARPCLPWGVSE